MGMLWKPYFALKGLLSPSFDLSPKSDLAHDEDVSDPPGQGLRPAPPDGRRGHPRRHQVPPLPVRAEGLRGRPHVGHPQLLQEGQGRVPQRRATFRDRLLDIRLLREGARQAAKETARSVRQRRVKSDVWTLKMLHRVLY